MGVALNRMVMHPVDRRRDHDPRQDPLQTRRQAQIGMMEHHGADEHRFENDDMGKRNGEQRDGNETQQGRGDHFADVKPEGAGGIQELIEMMHLMEPPHHRHAVPGAVHPVGPQIEQDDVRDKDSAHAHSFGSCP